MIRKATVSFSKGWYLLRLLTHAQAAPARRGKLDALW